MSATMDEAASLYGRFAADEARGSSPLYEAITAAIARDPEVLEVIRTLPRSKWQPNLLLGAWRLRHGVPEGYDDFRGRLLRDPGGILSVMRTRSTQTNEPARCAAMLPLLAEIDGPVALFEVGASAGLCLYPDRYRYRYLPASGDPIEVGPPSAVEIVCRVTGPMPFPTRMPEIVWRSGIDLNPLDVRDDEAVRWLEALIWPEQVERLARFRAAVEIARADPPALIAGDADTDFERAIAAAPPDATLAIINTATAAYFPPEARSRFAERANRAGVWISQEAPGIFPDMLAARSVDVPPGRARFLLSKNMVPMAFTAPHGGEMDWLP